MLSLFLVSAAAASQIRCSSDIVLTRASPIFFFTRGYLSQSPPQKCLFQVSFPKEAYLVVTRKTPQFNGTFTILDIWNQTQTLEDSRKYFPGQKLMFHYHIEPNKGEHHSFIFNLMPDVPYNGFNDLERFPVGDGLAVPNYDFQASISYAYYVDPTKDFSGELAVYYIPDDFDIEYETRSDTSNVAYEGEIYKGPLSNMYGRQNFSNLTVYSIDHFMYDVWVNYALVVLPKEVVDSYSNPVFVHDVFFSKNQTMNARNGRTFITIVRSGKFKMVMGMTGFNFTEDVEFLLYTGFPGLAINASRVIKKYNYSNLDSSDELVFTVTTSVILLKGALNFTLDQVSEVSLDNRITKSGLVDNQGGFVDLTFVKVGEDWIRYSFSWIRTPSPYAYFHVDHGEESFIFTPINTTSILTKDDVSLSFGWDEGTIMYTMEAVDKPQGLEISV